MEVKEQLSAYIEASRDKKRVSSREFMGYESAEDAMYEEEAEE